LNISSESLRVCFTLEMNRNRVRSPVMYTHHVCTGLVSQ